jgi:2-polyprenyl-3-methyl-5-hydroxy-6-metoxy-1,4-benzoquinol methylase
MKNFVTTHFNRVFSGVKNSNYSLVNDSNKLGYKDRTLIKILNDYGISNKNCLDIGPGSGRWINFLKKQKSKNIYAVDISDKVIDINKTNCDKIFKLDFEKKKIPLQNNSIDLIICLEVLEHLRQPDHFLKEIMRLLKKDSIAVFSIPNILSFSSRVRVVLGLLPTAIVSDPTHIKFYRKKDIIKIFSVFNIELRFYSSCFSLNIFNPKSKFKIPTISFFSTLDDSLIFTVKKL